MKFNNDTSTGDSVHYITLTDDGIVESHCSIEYKLPDTEKISKKSNVWIRYSDQS